MKFLLTIDRRIIFLFVLAAVVVGTLWPDRLQFPITPSQPVRQIYDAIDKLDKRSPILLALDFDPSSAPELEPMARAVLRQCFLKDLTPVGMTHWNTGLALAEQIMKESAMEFDDVELVTARLPLDRAGDAKLALFAAQQVQNTAEATALLRLVGAGDAATVGKMLADVKNPPAGTTAAQNYQKLLDAARDPKIPASGASSRKVNFARDYAHLVFDRKLKSRDLLWHLPAGRFADEPLPAVDEKGTPIGWDITYVASRTQTVTYGKDWCFLGYKAGQAVLMISMGQNLYAAFPTDKYNTTTRDIPVLQNVGSLSDFKYLMEFAAGSTGEQWIVYGAERYGFPMGIGCTAVMAPDLYPYYGSHQITGLAGGIKGAWEYERLVGIPGTATEAAPVQTVAHLLVIMLILVCNGAYFAQWLSSRSSN